VLSLLTGSLVGFIVGSATAAHDCLYMGQPPAGVPYNNTMDTAANGRGAQVDNPGITVYNDSVHCGRVSAVLQTIPNGTRYVEVGWYEDPLSGSGYYDCLPGTTGTPKFLAYIENHLGRACMNSGQPLMGEGGSPYDINVADVNDDGEWRFKLDGVNEWDSTITVTLTNNVSRSNGERASPSDSAKSFFNGLDRMNSSGNWLAWQSPDTGGGNDDPGFHNCVIDDDTIRVIRDSETC
jgi:hypothetical protein